MRKIILFVALFAAIAIQAKTIYVKPASTGGDDITGDGNSWATAYATPIKAFSEALSEDVIAVMQGTYKLNAPLNNTSKLTNIQILGGYTGNDEERVVNPQNTIWEYSGSAAVRVLADYGTGLILSGISFQNLQPTESQYGIFVNMGANASLTLEDCILNNLVNKAGAYVRGIIRINGTSTLTINRCQFIDCEEKSAANHNAIIARNSGNATVIVKNSIIRGTKTKPFISGGAGGTSTHTIINCTFINNTGGAGTNLSSSFTTTITNSIFYNSSLAGNGKLNYSYYNSAVGALTQSNCVQFGTASEVFVDEIDFYPTANFAGIDTGDNSVVNAGDKDVAGNERVENETVDVGAYENISAPIGIAGENIVSVGEADVTHCTYGATVQLPIVVAEGCTPDPIEGVQFTGIAPDYVANIIIKAPATINFTATQASYEVTVNTEHVTVTSPTLVDGKYKSSSSSIIYFSVDEFYNNPTVKVDGNLIDPVLISENEYSVTLTDISGNTTVEISATLKEYSVTVSINEFIASTSGLIEGEQEVIHGYNDFTFTLEAGAHSPYVSVNGVVVAAIENEGVYSLPHFSIIDKTDIRISAFAENVLPVSADTYVNNKSVSSNYITSSTIGVGGDISAAYTNIKGYLHFDLSAHKDVLLQNYNKARLYVVFESNNLKGFEEHLSVRSVLDDVKNIGLSSLTWSNSGEVASTYSGDEIAQGAVTMTTISLVNVKDSVDLSENVFAALASDGMLWYQLAMISSDGGNRNDGHLAWLHSFENGNADYVPQLVFSKLPVVTVDVRNGITVVSPEENGPYLVEAGESFVITFTVVGSNPLVVKINGVNATSEQLSELDGIYTLTLNSVTQDTTIELTQDTGTGLNTSSNKNIEVYAQGQCLIMESRETLEFEVYSIAGTLVTKHNVTGTTSIILERGSYIVKAGGRTYKVLLK